MAGRRPRSGTGSARQGPASGTRRAWSSAARPEDPASFGRPGDPAGPDILERAPGRWSVSRLPGPPRWLLAVIAVLVLAGGGVALVTGTGRPGGAHRTGPGAVVVVLPAGCGFIIDPVNRATSTSIKRVISRGGDCARPGAGHGPAGGFHPGSPPICVGLHVQARHPATQFGIRHRCYPGLA